ncbi:MAG: PEGA domain-containing protein [Thermoguttaceae bacterium]|jgi:hypothetical protein|nr:PEGA domain-containing protein [Thermoguttaceae bacterium]
MAPSSRFTVPLTLALVCLCACGCVRRRMTIQTNPPGALVYVDDYEIGTTPISTNFIYYGHRKIRLVKDGFETKTVMEHIPPPWYQYFPFDFVAENVVPGEIRDRRTLTYNLTPQTIAPTEAVLGRAEQLRRGMHQASGTTPAAVRVQPGPIEPMPSLPMAPSAPVDPTLPMQGIGGQPVYPLPPGRQ